MPTESTRTFVATPAVRESVPLLIGLTGPSGSGKSWSALRLATGIQKVTGGKIYGIDTESKRLLHYADNFKFEHVPFAAPFGSLDYLAAMKFCISQGAKIIIVDQLSSEHDGPGGMIDYQEQELQRLGGTDKVKMLAWVKPKQCRRAMINGMLQLNANFILSFRAKNVSKPVKVNGKTEVVPQGFEPIAAPELIYELTVNCLLMPKSGGVPTWQSEFPGERLAMKLPEQFKGIFAQSKPLDEDIGRQLAEWAKGGKVPQVVTEWSAWLNSEVGIDGLNAKLPELSKLAQADKARVWGMIQATANAKGWTFDGATKKFTAPAREPAEPPSEQPGTDPDAPCSDETREDIKLLLDDLTPAPKTFKKMLKDAGAESLEKLTEIQANSLARSLKRMQEQTQEA